MHFVIGTEHRRVGQGTRRAREGDIGSWWGSGFHLRADSDTLPSAEPAFTGRRHGAASAAIHAESPAGARP